MKKKDKIKISYSICKRLIPLIHDDYEKHLIRNKSDLSIIDIQIFNSILYGIDKAGVK